MSKIQSILFDKNLWNNEGALLWLKEHNLIPQKKVHYTKNFLRYRLRNPNNFTAFFTKKLENGIELIFGLK